jgi:hypothetical protein
MNNFKIKDGITEWRNSALYVQKLPVTTYPFIVSVFLTVNDGVSQEDFDDIDRFTANVIPVFEYEYLKPALNIIPNTTIVSANSAISPISMNSNAP